jgi:3-methyl-2-oxobutanoate hydroxymethyltransferase
VADMPFMSYQISIEKAIFNAGRFIKEADAQAVKLEGGVTSASCITGIVNAGIPVMAHIGLTPQSFHQMSGYKVQGKTPGDAEKITGDAIVLQDAGAFGVVLECIPDELAQKITNTLTIPTIGIGSGNKCDGQIQVFHDVLGYSASRAPKHAMQYDTMYANVLKSIKKYKSDIENI